MKYVLGKKMLDTHRANQKSLAPKIGRRAERFDPNAQDGDGDGLVQEGTSFERPATRAVIRETRSITGRLGQEQSPQPKNISEIYAGVKSFNGFDADEIFDNMQIVVDSVREKYGEIKTVKDALDAFKKIAAKVELRDFGNLDGERSDLNHILTMPEAYTIYSILHTLNADESLKKRRITIEHSRDGNGQLNDGGSNSVLPRVRANGQPEYPEYATKMFVTFDYETIRREILSNATRIDGVAVQTVREVLLAAEQEQDPEVKESLMTAAVVSYAMAVASHEAIHAIDMPNRFDEISEMGRKIKPNASNEAERIIAFSQKETNSKISKLNIVANMVESMISGPIGEAIRMAVIYNSVTPEDSLAQMQQTVTMLEEIRETVESQIEQVENMTGGGVGEQLARMMFVESAKQTIRGIDEKLDSSKELLNDFETALENNEPEKSKLGRLHKAVYDNGLNFLFEVIPPGMPGHKTDIVMTVDEMGTPTPYLFDNQPVKDQFATPEFMESFILSSMGIDDFNNAMKDLGLNLGGFDLILTQPGFVKTDIDGNRELDISQILDNMDEDDLELKEISDANRFIIGYSSAMWPPNMSDASKAKLVDWLTRVSDYGSRPHNSYRSMVSFFSPSAVSSAEVTTELISSLIFGGGAARVPMPADVRQAVIDILNWVYKGSSWKSLLPPISLKALGM